MFAPISKQTVVENIINTILEMIAKGEIRPGSSLPSERELACRLNVSRSSLREALKALAYEGIVEIRQGSGTYLTDKAVTTTAPFFSNAEQLLRQHLSLIHISTRALSSSPGRVCLSLPTALGRPSICPMRRPSA